MAVGWPSEGAVGIWRGFVFVFDCKEASCAHFEAHHLEGWGYSYYRLEKVGGPMSTLMACPDGKKTEAFVPVVGEGFMLGYNSKLPVVVYVPEGIEVRYRIWSASEDVQKAKVE